MNKVFQNINNNKILHYFQLNKFYYKTVKKVPLIKKMVISFDQKTTNFKQLVAAHLTLEILFFQKSTNNKVVKPNLFHKTKKGQPIGCKLTVNNKINIVNFLKLIFKIQLYNENKINFKINKHEANLINLNILEIYNFKKLENYYLLLHKLKYLNIAIITSCNNKNYNETIYLFTLQTSTLVSQI